MTFNDQKKAYAKEVFYNDTASVLGPLNSVPVTKAQSKKIKKGMAYVDVVKLLGSNGTVGCVTADKSDCMSHLALNRFWGNKDGSFIEVDFTPGNTVNSINYAPYQPE